MIGPSAEELAELQQANEAASEVTNKVLTQQLELDERSRTVSMLQKALVGQILELCHEKTCLLGFWPGKTQTGLHSHRS